MNLIVEVERDGEPVGHGPVGEAQLCQLGHVGRLDAERVPVLETDVAQGRNLGDREVPLRHLLVCRPGQLVVGVDFLKGCGAQVPTVLGYLVPDVATKKGRYGRFVQGVADERVGNAVLGGAEVDV